MISVETLLLVAENGWPALVACFALHFIVSLAVGAAHGQAWRHSKQGSVPGIIAYNCVVFTFNIYASYIGINAFLDGSAAKMGGSVRERLYGIDPTVTALIYVTAAFELYNTITCVAIVPEMGAPAFVAHHLSTLTLALLSATPPGFLHYYTFFFFGSSMVSSAPLCASKIFDVARCPTPAGEVVYPGAAAWHGRSRIVFAVLFLLVRIVIWPVISLGFWQDAIAVLADGSVHSVPAISFVLVANVFLTGLQFVWGRLVVEGIHKKLFGKEGKGAKATQ